MAGPIFGLITKAFDAAVGAKEHVLRTQVIDSAGAVLSAMGSAGAAGFVRLTNGTVEALLSAANTARTTADIVIATQGIDQNGDVTDAYMRKSDWFGTKTINGDVNLATAQSGALTVATPADGEWPRWQVTYSWSGGSTNTITILMIWQDEDDVWHYLGENDVAKVPTAASLDSHSSDMIAMAGAKKVGFVASNYTDGTLTIKMRGVR